MTPSDAAARSRSTWDKTQRPCGGEASGHDPADQQVAWRPMFVEEVQVVLADPAPLSMLARLQPGTVDVNPYQEVVLNPVETRFSILVGASRHS